MVAHTIEQVTMRHVAEHPVTDKSAIFPALGTVFRVNVDFDGHLLVSGHLESSINSCRILPQVKIGLQGLFVAGFGIGAFTL